jgi:hypothetical protein
MEQNYVTLGQEKLLFYNEANYGTNKMTFGTGEVDIESF